MDRVLIFANPIAGTGRGRVVAERLAEHLSRTGQQVDLLLQPAGEVDETLLSGPVRAAVTIGGDGTLRSVAARLAEVHHNQIERYPPLLIVPMGTANLMGQHLDIQWSERDFERRVEQTIHHRRIVHRDAGQANGQLFLLMAGVGMDAHIVHELDRLRRGPIHLGSYFVPAALALGTYRFPPLTLRVNGRLVRANVPGVVFVGNIPEYGTGFPFLPHARADDGLLDVCLVPCRSSDQAIRIFLHAAAGEHLQVAGALYTRGREIRIEAAEAVPVQVDGEPAGHTPIEISLLPFRIPFLVPEAPRGPSLHSPRWA